MKTQFHDLQVFGDAYDALMAASALDGCIAQPDIHFTDIGATYLREKGRRLILCRLICYRLIYRFMIAKR